MAGDDVHATDGFVAVTPNDVVIACRSDRWAMIVAKHPVLRGEANAVRATIQTPMELRRSRWAVDVWLCYRRYKSWLLCAVIHARQGTLITAYPTDAVKRGDVIWTQSE